MHMVCFLFSHASIIDFFYIILRFSLFYRFLQLDKNQCYMQGQSRRTQVMVYLQMLPWSQYNMQRVQLMPISLSLKWKNSMKPRLVKKASNFLVDINIKQNKYETGLGKDKHYLVGSTKLLSCQCVCGIKVSCMYECVFDILFFPTLCQLLLTSLYVSFHILIFFTNCK